VFSVQSENNVEWTECQSIRSTNYCLGIRILILTHPSKTDVLQEFNNSKKVGYRIPPDTSIRTREGGWWPILRTSLRHYLLFYSSLVSDMIIALNFLSKVSKQLSGWRREHIGLLPPAGEQGITLRLALHWWWHLKVFHSFGNRQEFWDEFQTVWEVLNADNFKKNYLAIINIRKSPAEQLLHWKKLFLSKQTNISIFGSFCCSFFYIKAYCERNKDVNIYRYMRR
jgi:hypothetical protein